MPKPVVCRAVLFDLDGTLADSYRAILASVNHVRGRHRLPPIAMSQVRPAVGQGLARLLEQTVPLGERDRNVQLFLEHHPGVLAEGTRLFSGVRRTLRALEHRGGRLAVCSNKPIGLTETLLDLMGLGTTFEVVLGPELVPHRKPAPDMLLAALARLQLGKRDVLYVGDMTIDIETARAAGIAVWVIATGSCSTSQLRAAHPDRLMRRFNELLDLFPRRRPRF